MLRPLGVSATAVVPYAPTCARVVASGRTPSRLKNCKSPQASARMSQSSVWPAIDWPAIPARLAAPPTRLQPDTGPIGYRLRSCASPLLKDVPSRRRNWRRERRRRLSDSTQHIHECSTRIDAALLHTQHLNHPAGLRPARVARQVEVQCAGGDCSRERQHEPHASAKLQSGFGFEVFV
jgi:hypothetical protein